MSTISWAVMSALRALIMTPKFDPALVFLVLQFWLCWVKKRVGHTQPRLEFNWREQLGTKSTPRP